METEINQGDLITLTDNREYVVFATTITQNGKKYVYLMTSEQPVEIRFAEANIINGQIDLRMVTDQNEKIAVLDLFKKNYANQNK